MGLFSKKSTYDPMSQYTPEQQQSVRALMSLAATGTGGGITLGEKYGGGLGAFDLTDQTKSGLSSLQNLLLTAQDPNSDIGRARGAYQTMVGLQQFNPDDPRWGYAAFNKALAKAGAESASALEREAAIQGNRYGTAIGGQKADLAENLNLQRQQRLAEIWQGSQAMAQAGAQGLTGLANQIANLSGLNITYGDMERQMKDTKALRDYDEFNRTRQEQLMRIGLMQNERSNPLGTITTSSPSAFGKLATAALTGAGAYFGGPIGGAIGGSIGDILTGGTTVNGIPVGGTSSGGFGSGLFSSGNIAELKSGVNSLWSMFSPKTSGTGYGTTMSSYGISNPIGLF